MGPLQRDGDGTGCQLPTRSHITVVSPTSISTPFPPLLLPLNRIEWSFEFRFLDPAEGDSFRVIRSRAGLLKRRPPWRFCLSMSFRSIVRDVSDGFGSLSWWSFDVRLSGLIGHRRGKSQGSVQELHDPYPVVQQSRWASLPPELLRDVIKRLEASESTWPSRKHVVACAAVCRCWREMCKEIVRSPEFGGKLTFPISLKQVPSLSFTKFGLYDVN
ncbi:hypothetical protein GW17_00041401 [Ensete ventricosum]|uniref:Uncharacterized protein n=1 Tax=Ensete ventricosum TaxID=4639 RepID=A0A426YK49_ENSVE|nr:hypothetical protein B296_00050707 [Ensete ventricosum]RWV95936.1 hypothetical protein GW17_00041401 [Ensete ventricosum]RZR81926.1 hypothetical protein BHM03_00008236 [Ensete ventricosum]